MTRAYDVWGNVVKQKETVKNRFKFTGEQLDPITQQYYLRARFYNPVIARFTQEDTYRGDGLNLYAYCGNNPIKYVDPTGNACKKPGDILSNATKGYDVDPAHSTYEQRINRTPSNDTPNGKWTDGRGESMFVSEDPRVKPILDDHNVIGVEYKNGMPDFSPFAVGEVEIDMSINRNFNYSNADEKLAEIWSKQDNKIWTKQDVTNWRIDNRYTWHELNDMKTVQLIPTDINRPVFGHFGGVAEVGLNIKS